MAAVLSNIHRLRSRKQGKQAQVFLPIDRAGLVAAGALLALLTACTANIVGDGTGAPTPTGSPQMPPNGSEARPADPACASPLPGRAPLRRLTRTEYDHTMRDLLGDTSEPGKRLLGADSAEDNADVRTVGPLLAEQYFGAAEEMAAKAVSAAAGPLACDTATVGEAACAAKIIDAVGARAFRRPLPDANRAHLIATYQKARATLDYPTSLEVVLATVLQSSRFLYRIETSDRPGVQRLDGHSLHTYANMPYVMAGSAGGAFETGRYLKFDKKPHNELFLSIMHAMGLPETSFGDPDFCSGPLAGL